MYIKTLDKMGDWGVIDITDDMNFIDSTWGFKLKILPDGLINKFKARFLIVEVISWKVLIS